MPIFDGGGGVPVIPLAYNSLSQVNDPDAFYVDCTTYFNDLISFAYPDINHPTASSFLDRAILSPTNATIDSINSVILTRLP